MDQSTETPIMRDEITISPTDAELCRSALETVVGDLKAAGKRRKDGLAPSERTLLRLYESTHRTLCGKLDRDDDNWVEINGERIAGATVVGLGLGEGGAP
jgi:hypothetical protein